MPQNYTKSCECVKCFHHSAVLTLMYYGMFLLPSAAVRLAVHTGSGRGPPGPADGHGGVAQPAPQEQPLDVQR